MLADPPLVYSPVFNPANFSAAGDADLSSYASLTSRNVFAAQNQFNGGVYMPDATGNKLWLGGTNSLLELYSSAITLPDGNLLISRAGRLQYHNTSGGIRLDSDTTTILSSGGTGHLTVAPGGIELSTSIERLAYYKWTPNAGTTGIVFFASNLPGTLVVYASPDNAKTIEIPLPSSVPDGTTFTIVQAQTDVLTIVLTGTTGIPSYPTATIPNECFVIPAQNWPTTGTSRFLRYNTTVSWGQSVTFVSVRGTTGIALWIKVN